MSETKGASPKDFGDQLSKMVKAIELPKRSDQKVLSDYWKRLCEFDFDLTNGELAWLKGTFGNRLYHINPEKKKSDILSKRSWSDWRDANAPNETDETWRNWRKVADQFTRSQSRKLGRSVMYATIRAEAEAARKKSGNKGPTPPVREAKVTPTPIASFVASWTVVHKELEGMGKVETAPDRFDDTKDKLAILEVQEANINTARRMLDELVAAIARARKGLEAYIAEPKKSPSAKAPKVVATKKRSTSLAKLSDTKPLSLQPALAK